MDTFAYMETIMHMIQEQTDICKTLYPDRVNDVLLKCYYDLVDIEMELEDE